ncbi:MAG: non-heme iron oxygenase ferredoxin subunit [Pseudomonadota bacterium]
MSDASKPRKRTQTWRDLMPASELEPGDVTPAVWDKLELAIYDSTDGIRVSRLLCTHGAARLCDGYFDGRYIECPLHQGLFDTRDGSPKAAPARVPLRMYDARIHNGMVQFWF